jgi:hypothetical protein
MTTCHCSIPEHPCWIRSLPASLVWIRWVAPVLISSPFSPLLFALYINGIGDVFKHLNSGT